MLQILISVAAFAVAIGILVAVHEYGHLWVARRMGVRILRYSIGFGSRIWGFTSRKTQTEYRLSALPLGGYVKMLDEREGPVAEADRPYAFNRIHPLKRIAVVAAGPGINFLFAVLAYWLVFMLGVAGLKPIIGAVPDGSLAASADLHARDRIVAIDGASIGSWRDLHLTLVERALDHEPITLTVQNGEQSRRSATLNLTNAPDDPKRLFKQLGLKPYQPPATPHVRHIEKNSPAARSRLQVGDRVNTLDGKPIDSPRALVEQVKAHPAGHVMLGVTRDKTHLKIPVTLARVQNDKGHWVGHLGAQIGIDAAAWKNMRTQRQLGPFAAIPAAIGQTWDLSFLTVRLLGRMITGSVSWHNVSGPIQIADYAGRTASIGLVAFISFLGLISLSLAILNLLPIPVLDGGHILYYAIEWIRGRPLSEAVQSMGQQAGVVALFMLMTLAFYNDIHRLLG